VSDHRFDELDDAQRALALKLRASLRDSERVDATTAAKLAQARAFAVSQATPSRSPLLWASGGLTAALLVAAVLLLQTGGLAPWRAETQDSSVADAFDVLTDDVDAELYEDLDLYRWLAEDSRA
jgi:ornithine cyclodeaminase/alanine dehydrogenase-like protein (mu-crystallin family)